MVVTIEPGIYFSVYALQQFYLPIPEHAKFINLEVLERYLPVGGVRIEDDLLITSRGYENLTTAPKGDAMFDIIRNGDTNTHSASSRRSHLSRRRSDEISKPLLRAPGLTNTATAASVLGPFTRAEIMPTNLGSRDTVDFEPYSGPSLFSNFKRSMTTEEKVQEWQRNRQHVADATKTTEPVTHPISVCGQATSDSLHMYISDPANLAVFSKSVPVSQTVQKCRDCALLVQTLDRLRQNLQKQKLNLHEPVAEDHETLNRRNEKEAIQRLEQRTKEERARLDSPINSQLSIKRGTSASHIPNPAPERPEPCTLFVKASKESATFGASRALSNVRPEHSFGPSVQTQNMGEQFSQMDLKPIQQHHQLQMSKAYTSLEDEHADLLKDLQALSVHKEAKGVSLAMTSSECSNALKRKHDQGQLKPRRDAKEKQRQYGFALNGDDDDDQT